jgi:hypothetical protein
VKVRAGGWDGGQAGRASNVPVALIKLQCASIFDAAFFGSFRASESDRRRPRLAPATWPWRPEARDRASLVPTRRCCAFGAVVARSEAGRAPAW